jgi:hypothetical protein
MRRAATGAVVVLAALVGIVLFARFERTARSSLPAATAKIAFVTAWAR